MPWTAYIGFLGFLGGIPGVFNLLQYERRYVAISIIAVYFGLFLGLFLFVLRVGRRGHLAAASAEGLHLRLGNLTPAFTPWSDVVRASCAVQPFGRFRIFQATVYLRSQRRVITVAGVFKTKSDAERFAAAVNAYTGETTNGCPDGA